MKNIIAIIMVLTVCLCLSACDLSNNTKASNEENIVVNFDLLQYENHGEFSDGLIWVEKTESSYAQSPKTSFAYLDKDGNEKSPWFNSKQFAKSNFTNGLVILSEGLFIHDGVPKDSVRNVIYDTSFNKIADGYFTLNKVLKDYGYEYEIAITEANNNGEIFGFGEIEGYDYGLFMITSDGIVRFPVKSNAFLETTLSNLNRIEKQNGCYVVDIRLAFNNSVAYMGVFDESGNIIFEPSEQLEYDVLSVTVLSKNEFEILFIGKDSKYYTVKTDSNGNFLNEPQLD